MKDPNEIIRTSTPKSQVRDKISTHSRVDFTRISDAVDVLRVGLRTTGFRCCKHYTLLKKSVYRPGFKPLSKSRAMLGAKNL